MNFHTDIRGNSPETNTINNNNNNNIGSNDIKDYETSLYLIGKGKLVGLTYGHNGMMKHVLLNIINELLKLFVYNHILFNWNILCQLIY